MTAGGGAWDALADRHAMVRYVDVVLRGSGQMTFQDNPSTGLLVLLVIGTRATSRVAG